MRVLLQKRKKKEVKVERGCRHMKLNEERGKGENGKRKLRGLGLTPA